VAGFQGVDTDCQTVGSGVDPIVQVFELVGEPISDRIEMRAELVTNGKKIVLRGVTLQLFLE
jgi:hypothetical protein